MKPAELRIRQIPHDRWATTDTRRHINNGTYPLFFAYILHRRDWGRHTPLFLGRLRLSFFRGSPCSARGVRRWIFSPCFVAVYRLPVSARLLPFLGAFPLSVSVSPSARFSCVFAPFPCVFLAFACLSCGYPLRRFHFNAIFRPFTAFFRSARAIYQGNKKSPF